MTLASRYDGISEGKTLTSEEKADRLFCGNHKEGISREVKKTIESGH